MEAPMSNTPHELAEEFPTQGEAIRSLKQREARFAALVDEYVAVNRQVHRAETRVDIVTEAEESVLRHKRSHLKDQIARALAAA
jgi:uncharacterized protein YdcH (DUF465 family)